MVPDGGGGHHVRELVMELLKSDPVWILGPTPDPSLTFLFPSSQGHISVTQNLMVSLTLQPAQQSRCISSGHRLMGKCFLLEDSGLIRTPVGVPNVVPHRGSHSGFSSSWKLMAQ